MNTIKYFIGIYFMILLSKVNHYNKSNKNSLLIIQNSYQNQRLDKICYTNDIINFI